MSVIRHDLIHSFKWSAAGEVVAKVIYPLIFIVLARLLTPEDFGVMAAATMVISFSQVFWDAGMAKALIQRQANVEEAANAVFWINLVLGVVVSTVLLLLAAPIAEAIFHDARVELVLQLMTLQVMLGALASAPTALMQKKFHFRRLFWIRLLTMLVPGVISVPLALAGYGYWALVGGALAGYTSKVVVTWGFCAWRPTNKIDARIAIELVNFGKWAMLSGIFAWAFMWVDVLVIGHYLDINSMGLYQVGNTFVGLIFGLIVSPVIPVFYSAFSRAQHEPERIRRGILLANKAISMVIFPIAALVFIMDRHVIDIVFGENFEDLTTIIGWLAVTSALAHTVGLNQEGYRSLGRPDIETKVMAISLIMRIPFYLIAIKYGIYVFVIARLAATAIGVVNHQLFAARYLGITFKGYWLMIASALYATALMVCISILLTYIFDLSPSTIMLATIHGCVGIVIYVVSLWNLEKSFLRKVYAIVAGRNGSINVSI